MYIYKYRYICVCECVCNIIVVLRNAVELAHPPPLETTTAMGGRWHEWVAFWFLCQTPPSPLLARPLQLATLRVRSATRPRTGQQQMLQMPHKCPLNRWVLGWWTGWTGWAGFLHLVCIRGARALSVRGENSLPRFAYNYVCYITNCILDEIVGASEWIGWLGVAWVA